MSYGLQYIQLLKSPPSCVALNQSFKVVLTITNDLTDEKCYDEITVECKVYDGNGQEFNGLRLKDGSNTINYNPYNGGFCSFEASLTQLPPCGTGTVQLKAHAVSTPRPSSSENIDSLMAMIGSDSLIIPVWTTAFRVVKSTKTTPDSGNQHQCERRLQLCPKRQLRILEDKEESIARHLWDSGVAICCFLASAASPSGNQTIRINHSSVVVELGSGTGLAGICAALLFKPRKTILTDLDDALELLRSNAALNSTRAPIEIQELDWNECAAVRSSLPEKIDTILLSDVLYNQEKHDILLEALDLLATPNTQVLLAAKERHIDERVFWEKIQGKWEAKLLYRVLSSEIYELQKLH